MTDQKLIYRLEQAALETRCNLLKLCRQQGIHIGGDLSVCDMMTAIWHYAMNYRADDPHWEGRDRFILSKGHAAAVTSLSQAAIGCYKLEEVFDEYATNFGRLGMHSCNLVNPSVDVSTGSLAHGLGVATGKALALKHQQSSSRVYVVCGDGEMQEGSIWESALFAQHYQLGNLVLFIDRNYISCDGQTEELMSLEPFEAKWQAFGWKTKLINGNSMAEIVDAIDELPPTDSSQPTAIIGLTTKGYGVGFMEDDVAWHFASINDEQLEQALDEVQKAFRLKWGGASA